MPLRESSGALNSTWGELPPKVTKQLGRPCGSCPFPVLCEASQLGSQAPSVSLPSLETASGALSQAQLNCGTKEEVLQKVQNAFYFLQPGLGEITCWLCTGEQVSNQDFLSPGVPATRYSHEPRYWKNVVNSVFWLTVSQGDTVG